jgi:hypothetical protein
VAHAAVATPPGLGALDALVPTCGSDGTIAIWVLRGHTLSRVSRSRTAGSTFAPPEVIATGADRLGPVAEDGAFGPLAWRSPTAALEELERDEWWAAFLDSAAPLGQRVRRGSVVMPAGVAGLGILAPVARTGEGVEVLGSIARTGGEPQVVRLAVRAPRDEVEARERDPGSLGEGELKAYEPVGRVGLAFAMEPGGARYLRALAFMGEGAVERGRVPLSRGHVLVAPRGVARGGESLFVLSEFDVVAPERARCLALDESLCVQPGVVTLVRVGAREVHTVAVAREGLVDTFALDEGDRAVVLYLAAEGADRAQRAARVDLGTGAVGPLVVAPADELPPLDHPALVRCGREPWLAAEVLVSEGDDASGMRESAVIALPFACLVR